MGRNLSEFFTPNALSHKAYFAKYPKKPYIAKIAAIEAMPVKKGGEEVLALQLDKPDVWIVCNITNAERLAKKFGRDIDKWVGKKIKIDSHITGYQNLPGFVFDPA